MSKIDKAIKAWQKIVNSNKITRSIDKVAEPLTKLVPGGEKLKEKFKDANQR